MISKRTNNYKTYIEPHMEIIAEYWRKNIVNNHPNVSNVEVMNREFERWFESQRYDDLLSITKFI